MFRIIKDRFVAKILIIFLINILIGGCQNIISTTTPVLVGGINSNSKDEYPSYSSDGRYLVFASDRQNHRNIFLYDLEQRRLIDLPNLNHNNSSQDRPDISSDGNYIVYVSTERGKSDIFLYDRTANKSRLLTANIKGSVNYPTISGDGRKVAFQSSELGQWKIVLMEVN